MGRIFETRKHVMFARWDRMAKQFARASKEIAIAVRAAGTDPSGNPALRRAIQNARGVNMPKDRIEAAIKRASGKDTASYQEILYEGYAPHGVALIIETATDNPTRTVAALRHTFAKFGGNLATTGSVSFQFKPMGVFRLAPAGIDADEPEGLLEHELVRSRGGRVDVKLALEILDLDRDLAAAKFEAVQGYICQSAVRVAIVPAAAGPLLVQ